MTEVHGDDDQLFVLDIADDAVIANTVAPVPCKIAGQGLPSGSWILKSGNRSKSRPEAPCCVGVDFAQFSLNGRVEFY